MHAHYVLAAHRMAEAEKRAALWSLRRRTRRRRRANRLAAIVGRLRAIARWLGAILPLEAATGRPVRVERRAWISAEPHASEATTDVSPASPATSGQCCV